MKKVIEYISVAFFFKLNFETCDTAPPHPPPKKINNKKFIASIYLQSVEGD